MTTVLLVLHLMIAAALISVVLLQRSEGGALGMGGGGGGGGFLTGRGTANLLTRVTAALAAAFFVTSICLTLLARHSGSAASVFDQTPAPAASGAAKPSDGAPAGTPAAPGRGGILDKLRPAPSAPAVPPSP